MSGVGIVHMPPYISAEDTFFGHWSTVPAEYRTGMPDMGAKAAT